MSNTENIANLLTVKSKTEFEKDVVVKGNLTVQGTSSAENVEQVLTKGALTIINSDNNNLSQTLMGTVIRTGGAAGSDYAIVYDPLNDAVRLGVGRYNDASNQFEFNEGEGYPIAVRDLNNDDDRGLIYWDSADYCLKRAPVKVEANGTDIDVEGNLTFRANGQVVRAAGHNFTDENDGQAAVWDKASQTFQPKVINHTGIVLAEDIYTYAPIGNAQYAKNESIWDESGKILTSGTKISKTNRACVGKANESLDSLFTNIFGKQEDTEPTVKSNAALSVTAGTTTYGNSATEIGTTIEETSVTITFTLNNSGTATYGYRCGNTKHTDSQTFYYPVEKQNNADIKITLPEGKAATVEEGTYVSSSDNILYCKFSSNKKVSIKISLPEGHVTENEQIRYGQISASVKLGAAQKENQLTAGTAITKFLTYLSNDASSTSANNALTGGNKSNTAGAYTISAGSYSPYYLASTSSELTSVAKNVATRYTAGNAVSIKCDTESYIWFFLIPGTSGNKSIEYEALGSWYKFGGDDGTSGPFDVELTLNSGNTVTYKAYRTNKQAAAGTTQFRIV